MRTLLALALVVTTASPVLADGDPAIEFERFKLPNGLEVILAPDSSVPLVAVDVWYHVGSGYEVAGKSGFAHLFEHMMFQGSKNVGEDRHFPILKKLGAEQINGTTNTDRTNYYEVVPANQLETALWLESDRMSHLLELLTPESLHNQIDVVRNEKRQRYDNRPYTKALFAEYAALYPEGHPYRYLTIGKHEDLVGASIDDVKKFFRTWYVPANATIAIVGDFDPKTARDLVTKWFGTFPTSRKPTVLHVPAPTVAAKTIEVTDDQFAKLGQITFAWHSPANFGDGDAELDIVGAALAREGIGRLYKKLVYDEPLAQNIDAGQDGMTFSGVFSITVQLRTGADIERVKKIVTDEVARLTRENVTAEDIDRFVAYKEADTIHKLESVFGKAQRLQEYNHFLGAPDKITWDLDRYRKTTPDKIRATVARYLSPDHMITIVTTPMAGEHHGHEGHKHDDAAHGGGGQ